MPTIRDTPKMAPRRSIALLACAAALVLCANASAAHSVGSRAQVEWVRRAATSFVSAELARNGAGACAILNAPLRASEHGRTCAQRWDASIARTLREPGGAARLRAQRRAIASAAVVVHGNAATIALASPLLGAANRFVWSENCWMLAG